MTADLAVFASGSGSNFEALARAFPGRIGLLVCNVREAGVVKRAESLSVPHELCVHDEFSGRSGHERKMVSILQQHFDRTGLRALLLAGYMRVLSPGFFDLLTQAFARCEILNLHPADPRVYRGARAYRYATEHRFNRWQLCVHKVTPELDGGPVLAMSEHVVYPWENESSLNERLREKEHELFVSVVRRLGS